MQQEVNYPSRSEPQFAGYRKAECCTRPFPDWILQKIRHLGCEHLAWIYHPDYTADQTRQKDGSRLLWFVPKPHPHLLGFHGCWKGLQQINIAATRRDTRLSA
jgi:hypothetical protein